MRPCLFAFLTLSLVAPCAAAAPFSDCRKDCPVMVVVPAGHFDMGEDAPPPSLFCHAFGWAARSFCDPGVEPKHRVTIARKFAIGAYDVTFAQWDACVAGGGCNGYRPDDEHNGRGDVPVINVSWDDAQAYVRWLSARTGKPYRLPSEAEWEYAARAGTAGPFWYGAAPSHEYENYGHDDDCRAGPLKAGRDRWNELSPVTAFPPNAFGLHDVQGNVYQWVQDCGEDMFPYRSTYRGAPVDGSARVWRGCREHMIRGHSWGNCPAGIGSRMPNPTDMRYGLIGFRVARPLQ